MIDRRTILNRMPKASRWYSIHNAAAGGRAIIRIFDEIGYWGVSEDDFSRDLEQITVDEIEVQISSPGGEVFAGIAIYNQLRAHPARIITRVDGLAASAASVIVQAGDERLMMSSAQMMIHEAWGMCVGPAGDMREFADVLDRQSDVIAGIYARRSGGDAAAFRDLMRTDTYLSDAEAVELGLADAIYEPDDDTADEPPAAPSAASRSAVMAAVQLSTNPEAPQGQEGSTMDLDTIREALGLAADTPDDDVLAAAAERITAAPPAAQAAGTVPAPPPPASPAAVTIDPDTFAQLRADAEAGRHAHEQQRAEDRDRTIAAAIAEGRITPARRDHYAKAWDADPDGTRILLTADPANGGLAPGLVPVVELGHAGGTDDIDPIAAAMNSLGGTLDYGDLLGRKEN